MKLITPEQRPWAPPGRVWVPPGVRRRRARRSLDAMTIVRTVRTRGGSGGGGGGGGNGLDFEPAPGFSRTFLTTAGHGNVLRIAATGAHNFGSCPDYNAGGSDTWNGHQYLCMSFMDFEDSDLEKRGFTLESEWSAASKWAIATSGAPTNLTKYARRFNNVSTGAEQGGLRITPVAHTGKAFTHFKFMLPRTNRRSGKFLRFWGTPTNSSLYLSSGDPGATEAFGWVDYEKWGIRGGPNQSEPDGIQWDSNPFAFQNNTWHDVEVYIDESTGRVYVYADNDFLWDQQWITTWQLTTSNTWDYGHMIDNEGRYADDPTGECEERFANIYVNLIRNRRVIGEAATFAACAAVEPQIPVAWSTSSTDCVTNQGEHASLVDKYEYHVSEAGVATLLGQWVEE